MEYVSPVLLGAIVAAAGILIPGLLNMTAARIGIKEGRGRAMYFAFGATTVVFIQAYIAVSFAKFISNHPDIIDLLEETGLCIFILLTAYFLFWAKKPDPESDGDEDDGSRKSKRGEFFLGVLLSALNFFPIPYYVFMSITLSAYKYLYFTRLFVFLFVVGAVAGTLAVFYLYIVFFKRIEHKTKFFMENVNYFLAAITGLISVITLIRLVRNS